VLMAYIAKVKKTDQEESAESEFDSLRLKSRRRFLLSSPPEHSLMDLPSFSIRLRDRRIIEPGSQVYRSSRSLQNDGRSSFSDGRWQEG